MGQNQREVAPLEGEIDENAFLMNSDSSDEIKPLDGELDPSSARPNGPADLDLTPISARQGKTPTAPAFDLASRPGKRQSDGHKRRCNGTR